MGITDAFDSLLRAGMSCCFGWLLLAFVVGVFFGLKALNEEDKDE